MNKARLLSYIAVGVTAAAGMSLQAQEKTQKRPNVLFIPVDDLKTFTGLLW